MTGFCPGAVHWHQGGLPLKSVIYLDELLLTNFVLAALFLTAAGLLCATIVHRGAAVHQGGAGGSVGTGTAGPGAAGSRGSWL